MNRTAEKMIAERIRYLKESTDFVSTLFESLVGYAIIASDFDGNVIAYNEGARLLYGYAPNEVIGKKNFEVFFPREFIEAGRLHEIIGRLMESGKYSYEGEKVTKDGTRFPASVLFTITKDRQGKLVGFIEIVEDLTERKKAEAFQKEQVEELKISLAHQRALTGWDEGSVTAALSGVGPLHERSPKVFKALKARYEALIDKYLEALGFGIVPPRSEIDAIAENLGYHGGGPRDVVDLHLSAVETKSEDVNPVRARAYATEGRLLALELMGRLVDYYRIGRLIPHK